MTNLCISLWLCYSLVGLYQVNLDQNVVLKKTKSEDTQDISGQAISQQNTDRIKRKRQNYTQENLLITAPKK